MKIINKDLLKEDYFKINTKELLRDQFKLLIEILLKYTSKNSIYIYESGNYLIFKVTNINYFGDYNTDISNFAYYNGLESITKKDFNNLDLSYNERNDLIEVL